MRQLTIAAAAVAALVAAAPASAETIAGRPIQQDGQPLRERDWLVTVARPQGGLLYLVFIAPERDFGQLQPTYGRMMDSLQLQ